MNTKCYNCKHGGKTFKLSKVTHLHCCHPRHVKEAKAGTLSAWDTLMEFWQTCEDHEPKHN
jgi:hypothetical protein